ncbi:helix-turn-helix domain-containing protein [Chryseobacterium lactis]|uniref:helix-turn-helix domain-containing protein n=1 Tax=Chryseobacterium lactis TaxID=1241981 RepID=UPI0016249FF5|nr:helix-turn-helix domain-containing protein [Chryseobacterium lactis]
MNKSIKPDYSKIYRDIVAKKFPDKKELCSHILKKKKLSVLDIIEVNTLLFQKTQPESGMVNQRFRAYDKSTILQILDFQKINGLNNKQLALHYKLSRNTVTKWRRQFLV